MTFRNWNDTSIKRSTKQKFDTKVAQEYGLEESIFLNVLQFEITYYKTHKTEEKEHKGRWWMNGSVNTFVRLFPFWTKKQIERIIKSCINQDVIITGNYNESKWDKTTWYAFKNEDEWIETK